MDTHVVNSEQSVPEHGKKSVRQVWSSRWQDMKWRSIIQWCAGLVLLPWLMVAFHAFGLSPWGVKGIMGTEIFFMMLPVLAIPVFLVFGATGIFFREFQQKALLIIMAAVVAGFSMVGAIKAIHAIRRVVFTSLAERSMPLVNAVKEYERDNGTAPAELKWLVPDYLPEIPTTGIGMYPDYYYRRGTIQTDYPWLLSVPCSLGAVNFDQFIYLPSQEYPRTGWGGWLEPMGRWAYVHE